MYMYIYEIDVYVTLYLFDNEERYDTGRQHSLCGNYTIYNQIK